MRMYLNKGGRSYAIHDAIEAYYISLLHFLRAMSFQISIGYLATLMQATFQTWHSHY